MADERPDYRVVAGYLSFTFRATAFLAAASACAALTSNLIACGSASRSPAG